MRTATATTTTHITGEAITVCGRVIQRCCLCGEKLFDSAGLDPLPLNADGTSREWATYEPGRLLRVTSLEGHPNSERLLGISSELPADSCIHLVER